ncbi:type VI secretion system baseplate subunit TssF [Sorangium sp. So ce1099]|uniref:type VI secretion system baseplate subunit TssF n=1 Tax=Sorangium sp. So ce1099 TaxID=3133331 RepID=UPI003F633A92
MDEMNRAFSEELSALEDFFERRAGRNPHLHLGTQDPDVRRLLEGMAFFAARTRVLAVDNLREIVGRLHRAQLDYMIEPMPAAALLQARVGEGLIEPRKIPAGTEVRVEAPDHAVGIFTTTRELALLPLRLRSVAVQLGEGGYELVLELAATVPLRGPIEPLSLFIDHRGSYRDSLRMVEHLRRCVRRARVSFDAPAPAGSPELDTVPFSFGAPDAAAGAASDDGAPPLGRVRSFFHFPAQDLQLNVSIPRPAAAFRRLFVHLELTRDPPGELLRASADVFQLFVVPMVNARRGQAEIITCDGKRDGYPIRDARSATANAGLEVRTALCSVTGVYQVTEDGKQPILPGALVDTAPAYEIVPCGADADSSTYELALKVPDAFAKPRKVIVDARWYQPSFDAHATGELSARFQTRQVDGVTLRTRGALQAHRTSELWGDPHGLLRVLALKTKAELSRDELMALLGYMGADRQGQYRRLPELVDGVRVLEEPNDRGTSPIKYVYRLVWRTDDPDFKGLVEDGLVRAFEDRVAAFLEAWLADEVELRRLVEAAVSAAPRPALRLVASGIRS